MANLDIRTVLRWLIIGVIALVALSLVGVLIDVAGAILGFVLKAGIIVLIVLFVIRVLEGIRD